MTNSAVMNIFNDQHKHYQQIEARITFYSAERKIYWTLEKKFLGIARSRNCLWKKLGMIYDWLFVYEEKYFIWVLSA